MSGTVNLMSNSRSPRRRARPYNQPFTGLGVEFDPLGIQPGRTGITLHETGFLPANTDWNFTGVFSPFWRLHYNWNRGHYMISGGQQVELTPEHILLTPHHTLIHLRGDNPVAHLWLHFNFTHQIHPDTPIPIQLPVRDTELCLMRDLRALVAAQRDHQPTDAIYRNSLALLQVVMARPDLRWQAPPPEGLLRVRVHIEGNLADNLAAPVLARVAGMSEAGLRRAFRRHLTTSPALFVTQVRVREAARRLATTDETIDGIAEQTGFPNRAYFSRVFKQVVGEAPARFRHKHREQQP
jgi:AraC-like DNA-binding protein